MSDPEAAAPTSAIGPEDIDTQTVSAPENDATPGTRSLLRILAGVAPATVAVQVLGFASSIVLARVLGASEDTDAYFLAISVPVTAYAILLAATRLGTIPALTTVRGEHPELHDEACSQVVSATLGAALLLAIVTTAVAFVLVPVAASGSRHLFSLTRVFILELAPYAVTGALAGVLGAILAVEGKFVFAVFALGFEAATKTALVLSVGSDLGVQSLVLGSVAGSLLTVVALWALVARCGIRLRLVLPGRTPVLRDLAKLSAPLLLSQSVLQVNPLIDRTMASGVSRGSVTVLDLALRLFTVPVSLLGVILIGPLTANWSARRAAFGWPALRDSFARVVTVGMTGLPLLVAVGFVLRHVAVRAIYSGGAYSPAAIETTGATLGAFLLGLPAQVLVVPLATLFIVQKDAVFPLKIAVANVILNVTLNAGLRGPLGVAGIALSTTLTLTSLCVAMALAARRRWGSLALRRAARPSLVSLGSALAIGALGTAVVQRAPSASRGGEILLILALAGGSVLLHLAVLTVAGVAAPARLPIVQRAIAGLRRLRGPTPES